MPGMPRLVLGLLAVALVGCGGASASTTPNRSVAEMRRAAIDLFFKNINTTALPRAYDREVLRRRMRRYMASRWLDRHVKETAEAIAKVLGRRYWQPWTESLTVGRWERAKLSGRSATVVFLAFETICPTTPPKDLPMERFTVKMIFERGRWRFATYEKKWLTAAGPMGIQGDLTIRALPLRIVFRNPPPRNWKYRGPRFSGLVPAGLFADHEVAGVEEQRCALCIPPRPRLHPGGSRTAEPVVTGQEYEQPIVKEASLILPAGTPTSTEQPHQRPQNAESPASAGLPFRWS